MRLAELIRAHCPYDGRFGLGVPDARAVRVSRGYPEPMYAAQRPELGIVAQGSKQLILEPEIYAHEASTMLIVSVDVPPTSHVMRASPVEPYLGPILSLDRARSGTSDCPRPVHKRYPLPRAWAPGQDDGVLGRRPITLPDAVLSGGFTRKRPYR